LIADVHCHVIVPEMATAAVPEGWRPAIGEAGGRTVVSFRGTKLRSVTGEISDVGRMLAEADAQGVDHLVLSPWIRLIPAGAPLQEALRVCAVQNEGLLAAAAHPRVTALAAVPIGDPAAAAAELEKLLAAPGIGGAEVPCSVTGRYLGDDAFLPFWEAAEGTGAVIFVHPTTLGLGVGALERYYLWNSVGNPLETTIAAAHLAAAGVLERFPGLRIVLAHGGGALPALRGRLRRAFEIRPEARSRCRSGPEHSLRAFFFDSLTHDTAVLADLVAWAGPDRVLLGSDRPFDMGAADPAAGVRALALPEIDEERILGGNAAALLGLPPG
jgi:aminocarboxymuconate-semialdehyde decarboxylase